MGARPVDDKPSDTLVVVSGEGSWTGSSTLPHLHHVPLVSNDSLATLRGVEGHDDPVLRLARPDDAAPIAADRSDAALRALVRLLARQAAAEHAAAARLTDRSPHDPEAKPDVG